MPEEARKEFVRKLAKQLRKEQGLKDESVATTGNPSFTPNSSPLFINDNTKGEWYFYNNKSRAKGAAEFKARWGTRPNVDNWRRSSAIAGIPAMVQANTLPGRNTDPNAAVVPAADGCNTLPRYKGAAVSSNCPGKYYLLFFSWQVLHQNDLQ